MPVVLVGDIDRGGVIAQLVGTHAVLPPRTTATIRGFVVNKFRGDLSLFPGRHRRDRRSAPAGRALGVVPWFAGAARLPAEDALDARSRSAAAA